MVYFKCFSGANKKQLDYYVAPTLVDETAYWFQRYHGKQNQTN